MRKPSVILHVYCRFGGTIVPAEWQSSEEITCKAPPRRAGSVFVRVSPSQKSGFTDDKVSIPGEILLIA